MSEIALSVSKYFLEKENTAPMRPNRDGEMANLWAFAAFDNVVWPVERIVQHVIAGRAICVAATLNNHRRGDYFKSAQIMGVDFDQGPDVTSLLSRPLIDEHAFLVYATPSSRTDAPRSRALFALDTPITDPAEYQRLVKRLLLAFAVENADEQCKDPVRIFYGSVGKKYSDVTSAVLPLEVLERLPLHPDETQSVRAFIPATPITDAHNLSRAERYSAAAKQRIVNEALATPAGHAQRHVAYNGAVMQLISKAKGLWPGFEGIEADLRWLGQQMGEDKAEIEGSIRGAWLKADAETLVLPSNGTPPTGIKPASAEPQSAPQPPITGWHTSAESMQRYRERLTTARTDGRLPLVFPFKALHEFGGFCRVVAPGVMIGIVGMSGGLKTSFAETITEHWRQMDGNDVLWWGPEWNWERMADRSVQRRGGANLTDVLLHELYLQEKAFGLKARDGVALPQGVYEASLRIAQEIEAWPGMNHYVDRMDIDIDDLLLVSAERLKDARETGRTIRIAVWDYLQLMDMRAARSEPERITTILGRLKAFCVENGLIGVVASQVTKTASTDTKENQKLLTSEAGQFFRGDKFNLVLTLNPIYDGKTLTDKGYINVDKNSIGKTGAVEVIIDPARLKWVDSIARSDYR